MSNLARVTSFEEAVCSVRATPLNVRDECVARVKNSSLFDFGKIRCVARRLNLPLLNFKIYKERRTALNARLNLDFITDKF
ncbi:hypothetical protein [uncultured Campylobacter sp.]|uniref:hypothetical protein n=1 Tax=uncultured Campylobacter sp. TaxID=218934 RepID=UPI002638BC5A|nr:hypothetical protein [uncultured Campylobacter sp.]